MFFLAFLALAQVPQPRDYVPEPKDLTYADAYAQAERTGQRLVVFVDAPARDIKGVVTVRVPHEGHWLRFRSPSIVVYREKDMVLLGNVALTVPDSEIRDGGRKVVSQPASPFRTARPDDAGKPPVGWPQSIQWIPGMRLYQRTRLVQRVAITNDRPSLAWYGLDQDDVWTNSPPSVNPNRSLPWRVPGGLEGHGGWESVTAAFFPAKPEVRLEPTEIANGGLIPAYRWNYADGTVFADLLYHDGQPFELRLAEKAGGKWDRYVAWRDRAAQPLGYAGAGRCASCHGHAGSSQQYGIMIRGGDTVFSYLPVE